MVVNTVSEAKANLSRLIEKACQGQEVIISRAGKPVVIMTAYRHFHRSRKPGALRGKIRIHRDFDNLPDDIADALGARKT